MVSLLALSILAAVSQEFEPSDIFLPYATPTAMSLLVTPTVTVSSGVPGPLQMDIEDFDVWRSSSNTFVSKPGNFSWEIDHSGVLGHYCGGEGIPGYDGWCITATELGKVRHRFMVEKDGTQSNLQAWVYYTATDDSEWYQINDGVKTATTIVTITN